MDHFKGYKYSCWVVVAEKDVSAMMKVINETIGLSSITRFYREPDKTTFWFKLTLLEQQMISDLMKKRKIHPFEES